MTATVVVVVLGAVALLVVSRVLVAVRKWAATWRRTFVLASRLAPIALVAGIWGFGFTAPAPLVIAAVVGLAVVAVVLWLRHGRSLAILTRWARRTRRTGGVATRLEILRVASEWKMRRRARIVRPSLRALSWRELQALPVTDYAVRLMRVARQWVYASAEDVVTILGGPRTGKTGVTADIIIDAPGAAVVTSTRVDLFEITRPLRARRGPVLVFNPGGLGGDELRGIPPIRSTVGFDPLNGCDRAPIALERAIDMLPAATGDRDREHWVKQARRVLALHMHAAALGRRDMHAVQRWISNPDQAADEVRALLKRSKSPTFVDDLEQFTTTNSRTRSSITTGCTEALQWLQSEHAVAATQIRDGVKPFDVRKLIARAGTLYLLGRDEGATSPLMAALVGHIIRESRRLASSLPGGRLDPHMLLALDEASRAAAIQLDDVTGDAGGSGMTLVIAVQSIADLRDKWGPSGASKILTNSGAVLLYGGTKDTDDLAMWSGLAGGREAPVATLDGDGAVASRTTREVQVLPPSRLSNLPEGRAVLFRRGMQPVIGRPRMAWNRPDVKEAARRARLDRAFDAAWAATADRNTLVLAGADVVAGAEQLARTAERADTGAGDVTR